MKVAIVEDTRNWAEEIKNVIQQTLKKEIAEIEIYSSAEEFLKTKKKYHIVFMDICLNEVNGLEATVKYKLCFPETIVMIVTSYKEYCREGYKVDAFRYIEKDNLEEQIQEGLEHALAKLKKYQMIEIDCSNQGKRKLAYKDIIYIETVKQEREVVFYTENQDFTVKEKIKELAQQLEEYGFFRNNKSFLVNFEWVEKFAPNKITGENDILLKNGKKVPLGTKKKKEFFTKWSEWKLSQLNQ